MSSGLNERDPDGLSLVLVRYQGTGGLREGDQFEARRLPVVVGRGVDAGVRLSEATVSRRHVELRVDEGRLRVRSLTERGQTWVDGEPLAYGAEVSLRGVSAMVQLGAALMRVEPIASTMPFSSRLNRTGELSPSLISLHRSATTLLVQVDGEPLELYRGPALVLEALMQRPMEWVSVDQLLANIDEDHDRAASRNVNQLVSLIRSALTETLAARPGTLSRVVRAMSDARGSGTDEVAPDPRTVARRLIQNRRGFGYRLALPHREVRISAQPGGA